MQGSQFTIPTETPYWKFDLLATNTHHNIQYRGSVLYVSDRDCELTAGESVARIAIWPSPRSRIEGDRAETCGDSHFPHYRS